MMVATCSTGCYSAGMATDTAVHDPGPDFGPCHVLEVKTGGYMVQSRSTPGTWYLVHGRSCSCPAGKAGRERCVHRQQVAAFVAALNAEQRRPAAPAAVSMLVD